LTRSSRAVGSLTAILTAAIPIYLSAQTIDTVVIVTHNVFPAPGDGPALVARLANALHVPTRPQVMRGFLLVNAGDRYDSARVAESARTLRALGLFSQVRVDTLRADGRLALRVETTDGWSTKPQFGYTSAGGDVTWLVGLVEDNFLGTATALSAVYNRTPDRASFQLGYLNPHFASRYGRLALQYKNLTDGRTGSWQLGVPFYETAARHSLGTDGDAASERILLFRDGSLDSTLQRRALRLAITGGYAPRATSRDYLRLWYGAVWRREDFDTGAVVPRSEFLTAGAGLELAHARFQVLERFNSYARREDVDLSQTLRVGAWAAPRAWGYAAARAGVGPEASAQLSAVWPRGFVVLRGQANGVFTAAGLDSGRVAGGLTVASQNLRGHTLLLHAEGGALERPKPGAQFDLWTARKGPRLFGAHLFTGERMAWVTVEDRILVTDQMWGLVGVGVAPFVDWGGAWYADEAVRAGGDAGVALRLGPTRAARGDVGEFAVGYRWFGRGFTGWAVAVRRGIVF